MFHYRLDRFLNRCGAGVLLDIFQQDLFEALRLVQEIRFAVGTRSYVFEIPAVHVLSEATVEMVTRLFEASFARFILSPSSEMPSVRSTMCL